MARRNLHLTNRFRNKKWWVLKFCMGIITWSWYKRIQIIHKKNIIMQR